MIEIESMSMEPGAHPAGGRGSQKRDSLSLNMAKPLDRAALAIRLTLLVLAATTIYALLTMDYQGINVTQGDPRYSE